MCTIQLVTSTASHRCFSSACNPSHVTTTDPLYWRRLTQRALMTPLDHILGSTLTSVMACRLAAPSHYLKQSWLTMKVSLWYSPKTNFQTAPSHYLKQCWLILNVSLWYSHNNNFLTTPSHYLKQCWLIMNAVLWHSSRTYFPESAQDINS